MDLDLEHGGIDPRDVYRLALTFVVPRPIGLVSTISADGRRNLAPFSFYNWVSTNPPVLVVCPALNREGRPKDTLANILATREFVVATVTEDLADPMNECSVPFSSDVDEFLQAGLTPRPALKVRAALVGESPVNLECRFRQHVSFGSHGGAGQAVFGDVVAIHVDDAILGADGLVDEQKLRAIGRLGRHGYSRTRDAFELPPPAR